MNRLFTQVKKIGLFVLLSGCGEIPNQRRSVRNGSTIIELAAGSTVATEMSYLSNTTEGLVDKPDCSASKRIKIREPEAEGSYPVLLYFAGTWSPYDSKSAMEIISEASRQGFVAATVEYQNITLPSYCGDSGGKNKLRCIFSSSYNANSALDTVCSRPKAACESEGVVVAGFSQGGAIAAMAHNWDTRIRGAWTMGYGDASSPCDAYAPNTGIGSGSARSLANDRLRIFRGMNEALSSEGLNKITGQTCSTGLSSCLNGAHGSGWYRLGEADVTKELNPNKHCFFQANGKNESGNLQDCKNPEILDPKWLAVPPNPTYPHGLYENIQWLKHSIPL